MANQAIMEVSCSMSLFLLGGILLLVTSGAFAANSTHDPIWNLRHVLPELDLANNSVTDVHFNVGDTAFLPCRFSRYSRRNASFYPSLLFQNGVSWIRRSDWQILSAGNSVNTNDNRFTVLHREGSNDWTLQLKYVKMNDSGTYECQVHSRSTFLSHFVKLHVIQPRAVILEAEQIHVRTGDVFSLTCVIEKILSTPIYIMWLHRGNPVNYAPDRPRYIITLLPQGIHTTSTLTVMDTRYNDSGIYTCSAPNAEPANVTVFVTEGDTVAAVQRRENEDGSTNTNGHGEKIRCSQAFVSFFILSLSFIYFPT